MCKTSESNEDILDKEDSGYRVVKWASMGRRGRFGVSREEHACWGA